MKTDCFRTGQLAAFTIRLNKSPEFLVEADCAARPAAAAKFAVSPERIDRGRKEEDRAKKTECGAGEIPPLPPVRTVRNS